MMLGLKLYRVGVRDFYDRNNAEPATSISVSFPSSIRISFRNNKFCRKKSLVVSYKFSQSNFSKSSRSSDDHDDDEFIEAFVLAAETVKHYNLKRQGFIEGNKWRSHGQLLPFSAETEKSKIDIRGSGLDFLHQFQSPTIFLKIACEEEILLPIVVGEHAIEKIVDTLGNSSNRGNLDQFQFVKDLIETLGYKVLMVRLTEGVLNTRYASVHIGKSGESAVLSVDTCSSDAIIIANMCKAPIYVSKQIVATDALRISHGRLKETRSRAVYDVLLDSAPEGPDEISEELLLLRKINVAVMEERYKDAALCKEKLAKLRMHTDS